MSHKRSVAAIAALLLAASASAHDGEKCENENVADVVDLIKPAETLAAAPGEAVSGFVPFEQDESAPTESEPVLVEEDTQSEMADIAAEPSVISVADYEADQTGGVVDTEAAAAAMSVVEPNSAAPSDAEIAIGVIETGPIVGTEESIAELPTEDASVDAPALEEADEALMETVMDSDEMVHHSDNAIPLEDGDLATEPALETVTETAEQVVDEAISQNDNALIDAADETIVEDAVSGAAEEAVQDVNVETIEE